MGKDSDSNDNVQFMHLTSRWVRCRHIWSLLWRHASHAHFVWAIGSLSSIGPEISFIRFLLKNPHWRKRQKHSQGRKFKRNKTREVKSLENEARMAEWSTVVRCRWNPCRLWFKGARGYDAQQNDITFVDQPKSSSRLIQWCLAFNDSNSDTWPP